MPQPYRIISADGHNIEPPHIWEKYLPKRFAQHAPRLVKDPKGVDAEVIFPSQRTMAVFMAQTDDALHVAGEMPITIGSAKSSARLIPIV